MKRIVKCKSCISIFRPKSKKHRLLDKGRKDLAEQTDIVNLLKQLRVIWTILDIKVRLNKKQLEQVEKSQKSTLRLFSNSEDSQADKPDPKDSQAYEPNFLRKISLRRYDPSKLLPEK